MDLILAFQIFTSPNNNQTTTNMEFIRTLREKSRTNRQLEIEKLYIAYAGTPLVPIDPNWTSKEIVQELSKVRHNYINGKLKENGIPRIAAAL